MRPKISLKGVFDKMNLAPPTENSLPKIRELSDFNEIFSVYLSMNDLYNALFILFQNFLIFFQVT